MVESPSESSKRGVLGILTPGTSPALPRQARTKKGRIFAADGIFASSPWALRRHQENNLPQVCYGALASRETICQVQMRLLWPATAGRTHFPVEDCVPICIKTSHSRSRPALFTTLEAVHKGAPGEIKASQIEREPHYAEQSDFRAWSFIRTSKNQQDSRP